MRTSLQYRWADRRSVPNDFDLRGRGFELRDHQRLHAWPRYAPFTCPGSPTCRVADGDTPAYPYALRTTDGGARWVSTKLCDGVAALDAIACPTPSVCEAVGSHAAAGSTSAQRTTPAVAAVRSVDGGTHGPANHFPLASPLSKVSPARRLMIATPPAMAQLGAWSFASAERRLLGGVEGRRPQTGQGDRALT